MDQSTVGFPRIVGEGSRRIAAQHLAEAAAAVHARIESTVPADDNAMWTLVMQAGRQATVAASWAASPSLRRWVHRIADAVGAHVSLWPQLGSDPAQVTLRWPHPTMDSPHEDRLAEVLVFGAAMDRARLGVPITWHSGTAGPDPALPAPPPPPRQAPPPAAPAAPAPAPLNSASGAAAYSFALGSTRLPRTMPSNATVPVAVAGHQAGWG